MESKNESKIRVTISAYFDNGKYRNNVVEIPIPFEVAKAMQESNHEISRKAVAKYLANNQVASFELIVNDQCVGGIRGMCDAEGVDETWGIAHENDEEEW